MDSRNPAARQPERGASFSRWAPFASGEQRSAAEVLADVAQTQGGNARLSIMQSEGGIVGQ